MTLLGPHQRCDAITSSQQRQPRFAVEEAQPVSQTPSPRKRGTRQRVQERRRVPRDQIAVADPVARSQRVTCATSSMCFERNRRASQDRGKACHHGDEPSTFIRYLIATCAGTPCTQSEIEPRVLQTQLNINVISKSTRCAFDVMPRCSNFTTVRPHAADRS